MQLFHGTTDALAFDGVILPPVETGTISESGRKKNLDRVFLTADEGYARIYAGRAAAALGGSPVVHKVEVDGELEVFSARAGASIFTAKSARIL